MLLVAVRLDCPFPPVTLLELFVAASHAAFPLKPFAFLVVACLFVACRVAAFLLVASLLVAYRVAAFLVAV
jgi:hypothetical protein